MAWAHHNKHPTNAHHPHPRPQLQRHFCWVRVGIWAGYPARGGNVRRACAVRGALDLSARVAGVLAGFSRGLPGRARLGREVVGPPRGLPRLALPEAPLELRSGSFSLQGITRLALVL